MEKGQIPGDRPVHQETWRRSRYQETWRVSRTTTQQEDHYQRGAGRALHREPQQPLISMREVSGPPPLSVLLTAQHRAGDRLLPEKTKTVRLDIGILCSSWRRADTMCDQTLTAVPGQRSRRSRYVFMIIITQT
ncbi:hypothetical protein GDO81_029288 [Engystomops pustulosus]|uniref:Uncharacterized protein n=1 Tax=Engystomops pustulosus TaxID=76066 RepID=A0AAV6Z1P1_ENGPU|nr:hypothetical protein GDO81_029288 [Engystomops pustulosus]